MNSLIIIAHPNKNSFSHVGAEEYRATKTKSGHDVRIVDLYDDEWRQSYLQLNETNRYIDDPLTSLHQANITRTDEIVFFFPLWWFDSPAILKNRFDVNYTAGFSHKYKRGKFTPEKLLSGKKVRVIVTTGGPGWLYNTIGRLIITLPRYMGRIDYVGMKLTSWTWLTDMNQYKTAKSRTFMRDKIRKLAEKYN